MPLSPKTNTQFKAQTYKDFMTRQGIKHLVTSVVPPQTNRQADAANRVILRALRTRLDKSKGLCQNKTRRKTLEWKGVP